MSFDSATYSVHLFRSKFRIYNLTQDLPFLHHHFRMNGFCRSTPVMGVYNGAKCNLNLVRLLTLHIKIILFSFHFPDLIITYDYLSLNVTLNLLQKSFVSFPHQVHSSCSNLEYVFTPSYLLPL